VKLFHSYSTNKGEGFYLNRSHLHMLKHEQSLLGRCAFVSV
jgi:hypothetical protein